MSNSQLNEKLLSSVSNTDQKTVVSRSLVNKTLIELQESSTEPFCAYIYDLTSLRQHIAAMKSCLPDGCELFYAAKANPESKILETLKPYVDGFEAASGGELKWLLSRCSDHRLIFGGPGKLPKELELAVDEQIEALHIESLTELKRLSNIVKKHQKSMRILLRMNIPLDGIAMSKLAMGGKATPFGLDESDLSLAIDMIHAEPLLQLEGFHFHMMSHQLSVSVHLSLIERYIQSVKRWCSIFDIDVNMINVGGGLGINYLSPDEHFDWDAFCEQLPSLIKNERAEKFRFRFECGRFITADCGYYVMEVIDVKKNLGEWFAVGHGGTHHFRTPAAQSHDHPFYILHNEKGDGEGVENDNVTLVGQLCTPKDVLARHQYVSLLKVGDWLVFNLAGAYAWNISHQNFLMHDAPEMLYLEK